jgi:hypothetical protein
MNLTELRSRRDVWPIIERTIPDAIETGRASLDTILEHPDLMQHLERKFRKGEAEHNGAWLQNTNDTTWLHREAAEEILDYILYQAMILVLNEAKWESGKPS